MSSTRPELVYLVWSPALGPIDAYRNLALAHRHAETMVGVSVRAVEIRGSLPRIVLDDVVTTDYDVEDPTPVVEMTFEVSFSDVQDASDSDETYVVDVDEG